MLKKIMVSGAVALSFTGCISQVANVAASAGGSSGSAISSLVSSATSQTKTTSSGHKRCVARGHGGSTSLTQMVTKQVVSLAISSALESVSGNKNIKVPQRITNTCEADKRLAYVKELTKHFHDDLDAANRDILASVEQTKEVQKLQAQIDHKKKTLDEAEYNEGVTEDNEKMLESIKNAKVIDKKKYSEAMGKLALAIPVNGYLIVGWDKEILEFTKDNMVWGIMNVSAVKDVASQLTTTIKVLPTLASLATSPLYNGRVDKSLAKKAAKAQMKTDKEIAEKAAKENGFDD